MKLKYNLIAWSLLGFFAAACDPMDDIYNEIDAEGTTNTQTMAEYVLTDADYEGFERVCVGREVCSFHHREDVAFMGERLFGRSDL